MRCFIGIKLENRFDKKIKNINQFLYQNGVRGNFTDINNIHLTLAFIGEINEETAFKIKEEIERIDISDLYLEVNCIKTFKSYLILEVEKTEKLLQVQNEVINVLKKKRVSFDEKEYYPHITLVRKCAGVRDLYLNEINKNINFKSIVSNVFIFESKRREKDNALVYIAL